MLFNIPASHADTVEIADQDADALVAGAFASLGWETKQTSAGWKAHVGVSLWSWGEEVLVTDLGGRLAIESRCRFPLQVVDWGKNRTNVEALRRALAAEVNAS